MAPRTKADQSEHDLLREISNDVKALTLQVARINGSVAQHDTRINVLWNDRSIWNWITRAAILMTPIIIIVANVWTAK